MNSVDYLVLGHGLTAESLINKINKSQPGKTVVSTSRSDANKIIFNLTDQSTWENLPNSEVIFWTFPPEPTEDVKNFYEVIKSKCKKLIVVGSTSAFEVKNSGDEVTEKSPLDLTIERVKNEVFLKEQGAIIVFSAGIYGPGRNPLDWINKGYVGKNDKLVNMVHLEDLALFLFNASVYGKEGEIYIASNNNPQSWREIIESWENRNLVSNVPGKETKRVSKRINNSWTLSELKIDLQFQNFADSVS